MGADPADATKDHVASMLRLRRARAKLFDAALMADPAWDILLQLFAARLARRQIRFAELWTAAPQSTLARWALVLEERGLISCSPDGLSPEGAPIQISDEGMARMFSLFRTVRDPAQSD